MLSSIDIKQPDYDYDYLYDEHAELGGSYPFDAHYSNYVPESISFADVSKACVLPTLYDVCSTFFPVLLVCLLFQFFIKFVRRRFILKHCLSGLMGIGILFFYVQDLIVHSIALTVIAYVIVYFAAANKYLTSIVSFLLLSYLTLCEFICDGSSWARVRNVQMLIVMKLISLISDKRDERIQFPSPVQYFGYIFCIGNCIFGPWISYTSYLDLFRPKEWNSLFAVKILTSVSKSLLFFSASMCYLDWIWPETDEPNSLLMYFKALEFRTSHYFIMFMSESFSLAIGHDRSTDSSSIRCITKPSSIEFPRSLVEVVVFWNVPMHVWLKISGVCLRHTFWSSERLLFCIDVFKPLSKHGRFIGVTGTYFVSSLLHGLNYQLSGILLSLAVYTYVEHIFRQKLARRFDVCLLSKPCELNCTIHRRSEKLIPVRLLSLGFSILALYHLSYLGYLIDLRIDQKLDFFESFAKWRDKDFYSHFVVLITFGLSLLL